MNLHLVVCIIFTFLYLAFARHPLLLESAEPHPNQKHSDHGFKGFKPRCSFLTAFRPSFLHVFIRSQASVPFVTSSTNDAQSTASNIERIPIVLSSKVIPQNVDENIPTIIQLSKDDTAGAIILTGSQSSTDFTTELESSTEDSDSSIETETVSNEISNLFTSPDSISNSKFDPFTDSEQNLMKNTQEGPFDESSQETMPVDALISRPFLLRKMLLPFILSSHMPETRFPGLAAWPKIRNAMNYEDSTDDNEGQVIVDKTWGDGIAVQNADGTVTYHKTVDFPHGHFSVDITSNDPIEPLPSQANEVSDYKNLPTFIQSALNSLLPFYNSIFGSILIGVGCGLFLSMLSFMIFNAFFPEENDEERTVFILSSSQSPTTPLLSEAVNSDTESVSSGENSPRVVKYQPPNAGN